VKDLFKLLRAFFGLNENNALLVCGDSGVGKTLFGFEVLREIGGVECGIYVSCGVSRAALLSRHGDLSRYLREVIDANDFTFPQEEDVYESISRSNLPIFLRFLYEKAEKVKGAFIFVDDFEGVCNVVGLDPVSVMELYVSFLRHTGLRSIVAVRREGDLGRIVDGVVVLESEEVNSRVVRRALFKKLCGVKLSDSSFFYTLLGGRFLPFSRSLMDVESLPGNFLSKIQGLALEKSGAYTGVLGKRLISFGSESFDRFLGGLAEDCFNLFVFDANVPLLIRSLTFLSIINCFVKNGGIVASIGMEPFLRPPPFLPFEEYKSLVFLPVLGSVDEIISNIGARLSEGVSSPILLILNIDYLNAELGYNDVTRLIYSLTSRPLVGNMCLLGVCSEPSPVIQGLASRVFTFSEKNGYTLVFGVKPWTPYYLLSVNITYDGYIRLSLTEMV